MAQRHGRKIFVNLPVRDLAAAIREPADTGAPA